MSKLPGSPGTLTKLIFEDGHVIAKRRQDCTAILDHNKRMQSETFRGALKPIATIPFVVIEKWIAEDGVPWFAMNRQARTAYLKRKLNDPDWRYLKTTPGAI